MDHVSKHSVSITPLLYNTLLHFFKVLWTPHCVLTHPAVLRYTNIWKCPKTPWQKCTVTPHFLQWRDDLLTTCNPCQDACQHLMLHAASLHPYILTSLPQGQAAKTNIVSVVRIHVFSITWLTMEKYYTWWIERRIFLRNPLSQGWLQTS